MNTPAKPPVFRADGSAPGKRRILRFAAAGIGLALAAAFGWWLSSGGESGTSKQVVELEVPPMASAETAGALTPPALGFAGSAERIEQRSADASVGSTDILPDPALVETSDSGPLPRIAEDGREPWRAYARAFNGRDDRPRLVVIVTGLGLKADATEAAIERLPGAVTLAFTPYAENGDHWVRMGRRHGHEILLSLPLESADFPFEDPGPSALLTSLSPQENLRRLEFLLGRFVGYVGVIGIMGSKFNRDDGSVQPILLALRDRGLMYVEGEDDGKSVAPRVATDIGMPRAMADIVVDDVPSAEAIDAQLARLEEIARARAVAVAIARPYPVTLDRLSAWAAALDGREFVLAPVSAVADAQLLP